MAGAGYFADAYDDAPVPACPRPVRVLRVLLWINTAVTAVMVVAGVVAAGVSVGVVAHLVVLAVPGAVAGTVAWRITRGSAGTGRDLYVGLLAAMAWQVIRAVSDLLGGDPRGLTSMALPLAIVILAARRSVRLDLRARKPAAGSYGAGGPPRHREDRSERRPAECEPSRRAHERHVPETGHTRLTELSRLPRL